MMMALQYYPRIQHLTKIWVNIPKHPLQKFSPPLQLNFVFIHTLTNKSLTFPQCIICLQAVSATNSLQSERCLDTAYHWIAHEPKLTIENWEWEIYGEEGVLFLSLSRYLLVILICTTKRCVFWTDETDSINVFASLITAYSFCYNNVFIFK